METERPLVVDPTEGEFPVITKTPSKLMVKDKSEVPKRTGYENLITDDGVEMVQKSPINKKQEAEYLVKGPQKNSPEFKLNKSIHANAGSGTTKFDIDSPRDNEAQAKQKSKSFLQVPPRFSRGINAHNVSIRSGSPVREPELLPLPKSTSKAINV